MGMKHNIVKIVLCVSIIFNSTLLIINSATAQDVWTRFDKLMGEGSYKSAYELAEKEYKSGSNLLAAAYHMSEAAAYYQEDVRDSAEARYRALLPHLDGVEKALCYTFLAEYDSALAYSDVLKQTPVEKIRMYCNAEKGTGMTPTAFDVVVQRIQNDYDKTTVQRRVELERMLVDFHAKDGDDIRIWLENRLLDRLTFVPNHPLSLERIGESIAKFRGTKSPYYTLLYQRAANWCNGNGDYVIALRYCDTAVMLAPKSEGGIECANLRNEIKQKRVSMETSSLWVIPGQSSLQRVRHRNVDKLYYRIVNYIDDYRWSDKAKGKLLAAKRVESGEWKVESGKEYKYAESYVSLPALKTGRWLLLVSPSEDFKTDGFMVYAVNSTEMLLMQCYGVGSSDNGQEGLLLDRRTGRPIAGQDMRVERRDYNDKVTVMATAVTDRYGRYRLEYEKPRWGDQIVVERDGYRLTTRYSNSSNKSDTSMRLRAEVRTDRPIYKPGDTIQVAVVVYRTDGLEAEVATDEPLKLEFTDPNNQAIDTVDLATDDFGIANASFVVPTDRIAGAYSIRNIGDGKVPVWEWVRVEEYKQPKFMVQLSSSSPKIGEGDPSEARVEEYVAPQFGVPYTVKGLAASYSAVPVSGARVQYRVVRRQLHRCWWFYDDFYNESEVASGETSTAADGSFSVVFTPEPDSNVELSTKPSFEYVVHVDVTDLNGESHNAVSSMRVGYTNAFVYLESGSTPGNLKVKHVDINGNPLPSEVKTKVELLHQPAEPRLDHPLLREDVHHTMTEAEWHKAFPLLAYGIEYNTPANWPVASKGWNGESGVYRVTISAEGADTVTEYLTYVAPVAKKVPSQRLLWAEVEKTKVEVGETARLRFGSRFKDVEVYYILRIGNEVRDFSLVRLSDEIRSIEIPVDSTMLGGFQIDLISVREGVECQWQQRVYVPFSHKQLKVDIATFRDKLLPGEQEEWTISVKSYESGVRSALLMTMYDDALNSYGNTWGWDWGFSPWRTNLSSGISPLLVTGGIGHWLNEYRRLYYQGGYTSMWTLKEALPYYSSWRGRRMYKSAGVANQAAVELSVCADEVEMEEESLDMAVAPMARNASKLEAVEILEETAASITTAGEEPQVRTNLNTLAFFAPKLRTGADGTVTYRFTVPELLTRWNVKGLAVTRDVKIGTLDRTLVTAKPLMVQPNMPRFLRSGDSLALMAKVVLNNEELGMRNEEFPVEVFFVLTDAATGDTICHHTEEVKVKDAAQVTFPVEVPQGVYVATYRIVATCHTPDGTLSDGEQGQMPVVTNRQAVTVSQAMYINGAGEKRYSMPEFTAGSDSREPRLVAAEVTSNPVWLAIKCMPYLKTMENPSTLYLANQLYINSKGRELVELVGLVELDKPGESRLKMNEDVKQTLLKATPWVQDAQSEEDQMAAVANYFDKEKLNSQISTLTSQLTSRQNPDGGWSWMPDGQSSLWVTQQVLKKLKIESGKLKSETEKALVYVDKEQQRYYEKYIKPYLKKGYTWQPTDIDYLYTRSFYGKANTEAYKFYYSNALKGYKDYGNLYTQAQLALIFHRHGDRKQALDLLRRIKEKSLTSDEMGMYWRDNTSSWFWYQRPIETQALLIQAFAEITPDDRETIGLMQQWLLKQKQTTHWGNEAATTKAIDALLVESGKRKVESPSVVEMNVFGTEMTADAQGREGYRSQRWTGDDLAALRASGSSDIVIRKQDDGIAWGAVYYLFADDMDKIPSSEMGITLKRSFSLVGSGECVVDSSRGQVLPTTHYSLPTLKVGDRVKVRIDIQCDRAMDYLELIDGRPSCVEPLSTRAGWRWTNGLSYYITVNNTDTRCYVEHIDKGKYVFEYEVYVTNPGHFMAGPVTMQCMYAPEFRAIAPAQRLEISGK